MTSKAIKGIRKNVEARLNNREIKKLVREYL